MPSFVENINKLANGLSGSLVDELSYIQTEISTLQNDKVDKVAGKQLSTEDYTTTEKTKLASLDIHPEKHPVSILDGNGNFSKFVKTDAIGGVGFDNVTWSDIQGKPNSFNPNAHQHTLSEISDAILKADKTYVDSGLALKANTTDVNNALALKADLSVVATDAELQSAIITLQPLSQKGQANGYVPLDAAGKIPNSYLNSLSTIDVYTASSQANMLLLSNVNVGDQCIRTDLSSNNLFILTQTPATDINNWKQINTSASVMSVNGQIGVVNVSKSDVGLGSVDNTSDETKNVLSATKLTTSRTISLSGDATGSASFDGSANTSITVTVADNSHNHTLSNISDFPSAVSFTELGYLDGVTSNIQTQINGKQETLVSGTNVKTINGTSIIGSGDLIVGVGDMYKSTYDTTDNGIVDRAETADKLTASKTINGVSFDGSANINIEDRIGTAIASAATITIGTAGLGDYIHITGTTAITSLGTAATAGIRRTLIFDSAGCVLTHNATSLICTGAENITSVAGTVIEVVAETTANWRVVSVTHPSVSHAELGYLDGVTSNIQTQINAKAPLASPTFTGVPLAPTATVGTNTTQIATTAFVLANAQTIAEASETVAGKVELATNAEVQAGTDTVRAVTPAGYASATLGINQTWQDVTASRVAGVTYTNSTGKPIMVAVSLLSGNNVFSDGIFVNGIRVCNFGERDIISGAAIVSPVYAIVNNGSTYSVTGSISYWSELR